MQGEARIASEVQRLDRVPHASEPQLAVGEEDLGAADARGAVAPESGDGLVGVGVQETAGKGD
jgi:hypothetical protein